MEVWSAASFLAMRKRWKNSDWHFSLDFLSEKDQACFFDTTAKKQP